HVGGPGGVEGDRAHGDGVLPGVGENGGDVVEPVGGGERTGSVEGPGRGGEERVIWAVGLQEFIRSGCGRDGTLGHAWGPFCVRARGSGAACGAGSAWGDFRAGAAVAQRRVAPPST